VTQESGEEIQPGDPVAEEVGAEDPAPSPSRPLADARASGSRLLARLRPLLFTLAVAVLAFFTGLGIFNDVVMPRWVHRGQEVRIPDLSNLNVRQAEKVLDQLGLRLSVRGEQFDPQVPKGFVLWQDPPVNDVVRSGRPVSVLVSLGEEFASLPVLYGESKRGASLLLSRSGLQLGEPVEAYSDEVGAGLVVATEPGAQAVVPRGSAVNILVSRGSPSDEYLVPDLRGREVKSVRDDLEALGFNVQVAGEVGRLASIVEQVPLPGSRIRRGETLVLKVAGQVIP
jgi:beta-lactam-binding protein with PASTA domain